MENSGEEQKIKEGCDEKDYNNQPGIRQRGKDSRKGSGFGYASIAKEIGLTKDAVVAFCRGNGLTGNMAGKAPEGTGSRCKECGAVLVQAERMKTRVFYSAQCGKKWWKEHPEMLNKKAVYTYTCAGCGREFTACGNSKRKYCSHACCIKDRFGGGVADNGI